MRRKKIRSGYTTGACAAAAAKAAAMLLLKDEIPVSGVDIPFPDGGRVKFIIHHYKFRSQDGVGRASVIKDAGDDPDVTNKAEIVAEARIKGVNERSDKRPNQSSIAHQFSSALIIKGGQGVGIITKPGLAIGVGESAINPVPRSMIRNAVMEAVSECTTRNREQNTINRFENKQWPVVEITISVPDGERLAKKTLNPRLGITGGISILGTTGVVRPLSSEAWTATIRASMDVAKATGCDEIVLSAGRASEKAHMKKYGLPEESYVMMGDYLKFSLLEAVRHKFKKIHLCAQWAKMLKIGMATPQTHVRHGIIDLRKAVEFLIRLGINIPLQRNYNTGREILDCIMASSYNQQLALSRVCESARKYAEGIVTGTPVIAHLISYEGEIAVSSG